MPAKYQILIITTNINLAVRIDESIKASGRQAFSIYMAVNAESARKDLDARKFDAVIAEPLSLKLTCAQTIDTVKKIRPESALILIGDEFRDETETLAALGNGAQCCVLKSDLRAEEFVALVNASISRQRFINSMAHGYPEAEKTCQKILAAMNYDIRTALTSIVGMNELLQKTPLSGEQKEYAGIIDSSCEQLLKTFRDAMEISKTAAFSARPERSDSPSKEPARPAASFGEDFRILVTEDNSFNQKLIRSFLIKKGFNNIEEAFNGEQCVAIYKSGHISAIIMDCQMPLLDGLSAARQIREYEKTNGRKRVPIIALTADTIEGTRENCIKNGMDDYITKPIDFERLYGLLAQFASGAPLETAPPPPAPAAFNQAGGEPPEAIFDLKAIENLKKLQVPGRPDIIGQLFDIYLAETSAKIDALKKAIAEKNQESIRHIAHNLKSSTANVGGARLSAIFKSLEIRAKNNEIDGLENFIGLVETNYGLLNEKLAQFKENKERS